MTLNDTPSANRTHIGFFGCRNAGKSSLVNAITGQSLAIVSDIKGTTTDPVYKAMELLPLGPVVIIDTPGYDDEGTLGELRTARAKDALNRSDAAVLVIDGSVGFQNADLALLEMIREASLPCLIVFNKCDLTGEAAEKAAEPGSPEDASVPAVPGLPLPKNKLPEICPMITVSALTGKNIIRCKELLARIIPRTEERHLVSDLIQPGEAIVLVCPIDESAPAGRLILPQQQTIRDILDKGALPLVTRELEIKEALAALHQDPAMVITDSQAFKVVDEAVPDRIPLTSFSILMARYKGFLETAVKGAGVISKLKDGDRILLAEGCTHHRQCNDIGTVKIPAWLKKHTGKELDISVCSGRDFPEDPSPYRLIIHCGGCMLTERVIRYRMNIAVDAGVPFTNYGIVIALMTGTLQRSIRMFPDLYELFEG